VRGSQHVVETARADQAPSHAPSSAPSPEGPHRHARGARRISFVLFVLISVWGLLMRQFGGADMYSVMGPYALAVVIVLWLLRPRALKRWLVPTRYAILHGLLGGTIITVGTYFVYDLAAALIPGLDSLVEGLYGAANTQALPVALAWVSLIILAEEVLWRGVLLESLDRRLPRAVASIVSVSIYTVAQLGSGSWVVAAMALVCGSIWTWQRRASDSLVAPLLSHLIWTPTVILIHPVT
jgi:membrane protease YdiL (CAAX protease family)